MSNGIRRTGVFLPDVTRGRGRSRGILAGSSPLGKAGPVTCARLLCAAALATLVHLAACGGATGASVEAPANNGNNAAAADGNCVPVSACYSAASIGGVCQQTMLADGSSCDDGNACTTDAVCHKGACVGTPVTCGACAVYPSCDANHGCGGTVGIACNENSHAIAMRSFRNQNSWIVDARFGDASTTMPLSIDIGSPGTGVLSSLCTSSCAGLAPLYNPDATVTSLARQVSPRYGDGTYGWDGSMFLGDVALGDGVQVPLQFAAIGNNMLYSASMMERGLFGLGPIRTSGQGFSSFVDTWSYVTGAPHAFATQICNPNGRLWLGGYDPHTLAEPLRFTPLLAESWWQVQVNDLVVGGVPQHRSSADFGLAIVDNGSADVSLPANPFAQYYAALAANANVTRYFAPTLFASANNCAVPLQTVTREQLDAQLPSFGLVLPADGNNATFTLELAATDSYLRPILDASGEPTSYCSAVQSSTVTVFSSALMRTLLLVFDLDNHRLGLARHWGCQAVGGSR